MALPRSSRKRPQAIGSQTHAPSSEIESLRASYFSLHAEEQNRAIDALGGMKDPEAVRELIQIYRNCQWRNTRLRIIRILSLNPAQRGLEFLFQLIRQTDDLPISEAAIWSLGQTHAVHAARFMTSFYQFAPETLRPALVAALGQVPDRSFLPGLLAELPRAMKANHSLLVRNLLLTLGELKAQEAIPSFLEVMENGASSDLRVSALISIGKVARDPSLLDAFEVKFRDNMLEQQLFMSAKQQIHFRSQWKLEDYLQRIFESPSFHRTLPYELNHFDAKDVKEGFKLFSESKYFERCCLALSKLNFPNMALWYSDIFKLDQLTPDQLRYVLESVAWHSSDDMSELLDRVHLVAQFDSDTLLVAEKNTFKKWTQAIAFGLPSADRSFKKWMEPELFRKLTLVNQVHFLNAFSDFGLSVLMDSARLQSLEKILVGILGSDFDFIVQGRALRVAGVLGFHSNKKIFEFAKSKIRIPELAASCLRYFELNGNGQGFPVLSQLLENPEFRQTHALGLLKALEAQPSLPIVLPELDEFLKTAVKDASSYFLRIQAIQLLARHPRKALLPSLLKCLESDPLIALQSIIALKEYSEESIADQIAPFLESKNPSLMGRALDSLLAIPGLRAKRLVMEFLQLHGDDQEICDKVIRCFRPPESASPYFSDVINSILVRFSDHPLQDGLHMLREKLLTKNLGQCGSSSPKGADTTALDQELSKHLKIYKYYDESIQAALRSAEVPIRHPDIFNEHIDKSASVLGYCKATDMIIEQEFGKKRLLPKLESQLHEFQNILYLIGLNDSSPSPERVLGQLGLSREHFSLESFPLHKMSLISQGILSGRILNEHFKIIDGLRAWAILFLLFCRPFTPKGGSKEVKPLLPLKSISGSEIVGLSKRLLALQEIRNPAAHRQTLLKFLALDEVRREVFQLLNRFGEIF